VSIRVCLVCVSVCVSVCIRVVMVDSATLDQKFTSHTHTHTHTHIYIFIYTHSCLPIHIHTCTHICMYIYIHMYNHSRTRMKIHVWVYMCKYVCAYVHVNENIPPKKTARASKRGMHSKKSCTLYMNRRLSFGYVSCVLQ